MAERIEGRVIKGLGGLYEVLAADGVRYSCRARGIFRHAEEKVLVGDRVRITTAAEGNVICEILPRTHELIRPPMANLDILYAVTAVRNPAPAPLTLDKLLAIADHGRLSPAVVLTKRDLDSRTAESLGNLYRKAGFPVFAVSAESGEGIEDLRTHLKQMIRGGHCAAFAGASGVGKSTLINRLFPGLALATGAVSAKIGRGRHTTRHVELFELPDGFDGFLADTPGFSLIDFERFDFFALEDLFDAFREFRPYAGRCRYGDCSHTREGAADCAIVRAVEEGAIDPGRHASYCELYRILKAKKQIYS